MGNTMSSSQINSIDSLSLEFDNFDDFNESIRGWSTSFNQVERGLAKVRLRQPDDSANQRARCEFYPQVLLLMVVPSPGTEPSGW